MFASLALPVLVVATLKLGVASPGEATAARAIGELAQLGAYAGMCDVDIACVEDPQCARKTLDRCDVDALVHVDARFESDAAWVRTVVVDGDGTVAFALDEPAGKKLLSPAVRASVSSLQPRERAPSTPVTTSGATANGTGETLTPPVEPSPADGNLLWLGVGGATVGAALAGIAGAVAGANELVLRSAVSTGDEKTTAQDTARAAWIFTAAGAALLGVSGIVVATSWPSSDDAPAQSAGSDE